MAYTAASHLVACFGLLPCHLYFIQEYTPSDKYVILSLFRDGIIEHVYPSFFKTMSHPDHIGIALSISMAGYVLGGSSFFQALLFGSAWAGLLYYCCREIYEGYMTRRLSSDMANIQANYLENSDNGFWVAEADVGGKAKVVGILAVMGKKEEEESERFDNMNGGKALDFCKEQGYGRLVLEVSSPQTAAISLCKKFGFVQIASHSNTHTNRWVSKLARINVLVHLKTVHHTVEYCMLH
uniref:N-acetyltransferase domain-containing protein n=1 Tax=Cynoglossus semilaevis TaxID=244447 RepID=A0A3P8W9V9_CYNSE